MFLCQFSWRLDLLYARLSIGALHLSAVMHPDELYFHTIRCRLLVEPEHQNKITYTIHKPQTGELFKWQKCT